MSLISRLGESVNGAARARWSRELPVLLLAGALVSSWLCPAMAVPQQITTSQAGPTFTVTSLDDPNPDGGFSPADCAVNSCSLRNAIKAVNFYKTYSGQTNPNIKFADGLTGDITWGASGPHLLDAVVIQGPGRSQIRLVGGGSRPIFTVDPGVTVTISALTFQGNTTDLGGAIANYGNLTMRACTLTGNTGTSGGGGIFNYSIGTLSVENCLLKDNDGRSSGGGLYNQGTATLSNSTLTGNRADGSTFGRGGAIYNASGALNIRNCTITGNVAKINDTYLLAGGINSAGAADTSPVHISNSIVAGNTPGDLGHSFDSPAPEIFSDGYNLVGTGSGASRFGADTHDTTGLQAADLKLDALADNGGPSQTFALSTGSPAINAGDPAFDGTGLTDQRGLARVRFRRIDIGAFEVQPLPSSPPTDITLSNSSVAENLDTGTVVGTLTAADPDAFETANPDGFTFALVHQSGVPNDNALFTISGRELKTAASFDYETKQSYTVRIETGDPNDNYFTKNLTISVSDVNEAPVITSDGGGATGALNVVENSTAVTTVTATDVDSTNLTYSLGGGADDALFAIDATSGILTFQLAPNFEAPADADADNVYQVTVQVSDDGTAVASDTQDLSITVTNVNEAPTAVDDEYTVSFLLGGTIAAPGILSNDTDPEGDAFTIVDGDTTNAAGTLDPVSGPAHGTLTLNADGSFTYTPSVGFAGDDSFSYKVTDGSLQSNVASVTIHVSANTAPNAVDDSSSTTEDHFVDIDVIANDTDAQSDTANLTVDPTSIAAVTGGTAVLRSDNRTIRFTPAANANGSAFSFTYKVSDGTDSSATAATVSITVTPVNDAPSFIKGANQSLKEGSGAQSISGWATGLKAGPADEADQTLDFLVSNNNNALFTTQPSIDSSGTLSYTLKAATVGKATVTVKIHDNGGTANSGSNTSAAQSFTITVSDGTRPSVLISSPTSNQKVGLGSFGPSSFKGSASDNIGVTAVKLKLYRKRGTVTTYWNGTTFDTAAVTVPATLTDAGDGSFNWVLDDHFPTSADLDLGAYSLYVFGYDAAGNVGSSTGLGFSVVPSDTEKPLVAVTAPTANQKLLIADFTAGAIRGSCSDNKAVTSVKLRLSRKRGNSTEFWTGATFQTALAYAPATLNSAGTAWSLESVPTAAQLDSGPYIVVAYATDAAANTGISVACGFTLGTDFTAPSVSILSPAANAKINASDFGSGTINGSADDNIGVTSVTVRLVRKRGTKVEYWNGTAFTTTPAVVNASLLVVITDGFTASPSTEVPWVLDQAPAAGDLDNGVYTITAYAYDAVGNARTSVGRSFSIYGAATVTSAEAAPNSSAGGS